MPTRKPKYNMKEINGIEINQRVSDGYLDATAMCDSCDKELDEYLNIRFTSRFINELSRSLGITETELIQFQEGNDEVWVHPMLAINLAQWCSVKLAVIIPQWVFDWMYENVSQEKEVKSENPPKNKFDDYDPQFGEWISKAIAYDPRKKKDI